MKKFYLYILFCLVLIPSPSFAMKNDVLVSSETKYYKTIYESDSDVSVLSNVVDKTIEISEQEYNDVYDDVKVMESNSNQTSYKKITISIYKSGNDFKYEVNLEWKKIPKVRSNDIIAIGFDNKNIKANGNYSFIQNFCTSDGCKSNNSYSLRTFSTGSSATFSLPTSSLTYLNQIFSFTVVKKITEKIISQTISGDYSHATSKINSNNALKHSVDVDSGIKLYNSISSYYDSIPVTKTTWTGSW